MLQHLAAAKLAWILTSSLRLPTEFDNMLLNAAGYFDVSPYISFHTSYRLASAVRQEEKHT